MNHYSDLIKAVDSANVALARSIIIGYANQSVEKLTGKGISTVQRVKNEVVA